MGITKIQSDNESFQIDLLHKGCSENQYLRELVMNGIDAKRTDSNLEILIDIDWDYYQLNGVYKMCISDNGKGLSALEIREFLNKMSSSSSTQDFMGNFGIGAKISTYPISKKGVIYKSWKDDKGILGVIISENNDYGLEHLEKEDGSVTEILDLPDNAWKPLNIEKVGTSVTICGNSENENTFLPQNQKTTLWILRYLNRKFLNLPEGVSIKVRYFSNSDSKTWPTSEPKQLNNEIKWYTVHGSKYWLDKYSAKGKGTVSLSNGKMHWWIIDELNDNGRAFDQKAHIAILHKGELYNYQEFALANRKTLNSLGIYAGADRIVMYFEPNPDKYNNFYIQPSRSSIEINGENPWLFATEEFKKKIPAKILKFVEEEREKGRKETDLKSLAKAFKKYAELYKGMGFRHNNPGIFRKIKHKNSNPENVSFTTTGKKKSKPVKPKVKSKNTNRYIKSNNGTAEAAPVSTIKQPEIIWANSDVMADNEKDTVGFYDNQNNVLTINKDFSVFQELYSYFADKHDPNKYDYICNIIDDCIASKLVDAVISAKQFENTGNWTETGIDSILNPFGLSFIAMQKLFLLNEIESKIIVNLGKSK